ncbi:MAG: S9 family peptidase [Gemmatimonadaceae bacterium]
MGAIRGLAAPVLLALSLSIALPAPVPAQAGVARRLPVPADIYRLREVEDPRLSPDGAWVAYVVTVLDSATDRSNRDLWMTSWDGATTIRLTSSPDGESAPRWSPDGRYLSFTSSRQGARGPQLWLLDRRGGEAVRVSDLRGGFSDYAWSPDSRRIALVSTDPDPAAAADSGGRPRPIVIDRYLFKSGTGNYHDRSRDHLYLFDVAARTAIRLLDGPFEEEGPSWSPDGRRIAFVSNRTEPDPDRANNGDVWVIDARAGAVPSRLTSWPGPDRGPVRWSPDGLTIAYRQGSEPRYQAYNLSRLAVVPATGGEARLLTATLDRDVADPLWSVDGRSIIFTVEDDRTDYLARVSLAGGTVERLTGGDRTVSSPTMSSTGRLAVLLSTPTRPAEVHVLNGDSLRSLSRQNDAWLAGLRLPTTEGISATSSGGTTVNGLLVKPVDYQPGRRYPTLLRIHGGPNLQDSFGFHLERMILAAHGYVVVTANYRGSAGRGSAYGQSIFADWGNREVDDLLAMTDRVVAMGVADPARLGIGGWSYGAILTNYVIARDHRFRAAISGAGSSLQLSMYGSDQYTRQYDLEMGPPWKSRDRWIAVSYPFFEADRITTPTLFMGGDADFNVPIIGSEQMYQALRGLGVPTQLVVYPGQGHGIGRPSFKVDRLERYLAWYDRYLGPGS